MNDEYAISAAKPEYREAYNTADLDRLLSVFATEFTDCSDGEPSFYGEEAVIALRIRAEELFRTFDLQLQVTIIEIVVKGDFAYDWGWHTFHLTNKNSGETTKTKSRYFSTSTKTKAQSNINSST